MYIEWLQIQNVRNLTNLRIQPAARLNILVGPNASGKTSVLEAIYLLSMARSFRTPRIREVIQYQKQSLIVTAGLRYTRSGLVNTGIEKGTGTTVINFNGENVKKISEQARNIPLILIAPDIQNLALGTPRQRRHWLDWAMFHVEPTYLDDWRDYHKALRQRNTLLKGLPRAAATISGWEQVMMETADRLTRQRQRFLGMIEENLALIVPEALPFSVRVELYQGWQAGQPLSLCLEKSRGAERLAGFTRQGLHCSDIRFYADERPLASFCSRGQIKVFQILLLVSQAKTLETITGTRPLYLLDDFQAEIDGEASHMLMDILGRQDAQVFSTATAWQPAGPVLSDIKMFHVERGNLVKVVE